MKLKQRTLDEMITYFNQQVDQMDIDRKYKIQLLGMITAIGYQNIKQERTGQWIPCGERLPDTDDHVLCTTITRKGVRNIVRGYYFHDDSYPGGGQWSAGMNSNVIAWMPLPEPYKEKKDD